MKKREKNNLIRSELGRGRLRRCPPPPGGLVLKNKSSLHPVDVVRFAPGPDKPFAVQS